MNRKIEQLAASAAGRVGDRVLNEESVRIGGKPLARGNRSKEKKKNK